MANWSTLKTAVADVINANGNQAITGQLLQNVLNNIITNVGENATFAGIATADTNPGAPDGPVFYLATTADIYPNFNSIEVLDGEAVILEWGNSTWTKKVTGFATQEKLSELDQSLRSEMTGYYESIEPDLIRDGFRVNPDGSIASDTSYSLSQYIVKEGDLFSVEYPSSYGSTSSRLYAIYNNSNIMNSSSVIEIGDVCDGVKEKKVYIKIPKGGQSILICAKVLSYENKIEKAKPISEALGKLDKKIEDEIERSKSVDEKLISETEVKVEGTLYSGKGLIYNGGINSNEYQSVIYYPVKVGEKYHLVQPNIVGSTGARMYAFYNSENPSSSTCIEIGDEFNAKADFDVEVPKEAVLMVVGKVAEYSITVTKYEKTDKIEDIISRLDKMEGSEETIISYEDMKNDSLKYQKKIDSNGNISDTPYDSLYLYTVVEGNKYKVVGQHIGSGPYLYAFYSSTELSSETMLERGPMAMGGIVKDYDFDVVAPKNAVCLVVTRYIGSSSITNHLHAQQERVVIVDKMAKAKPMYVSIKTDDVFVNYRYSTEDDIQVRFTKCGPNKLMQLYSHGFIPNETEIISMESPTEIKLSGSDWVGPYVMKANNREGSYNGFTGGWHGYNGDQTGTPTGYTESVRVYIDNREKVDGGYFCDTCRIVVTNFIQGGNTKKEDGSGVSILKEIVTYLIKDRKIYVSLEMEALEDLSISTYYGMQINNYYGTKIKFVGDSILEGGWSDSMKSTSKNVRFFISSDNEGRCVKAQLNEIGLGFKIYSDSSRYAFVSGAKAYYSLVGGSVLTLSEGSKAMWNGFYEFSPFEDLVY